MATYAELTIEQGATFSSTVTVYDGINDVFDITGYTPSAQIRKSYYTNTASNLTAYISDAANGEITLAMTAANTALLMPGRYVYDLVMENATIRLRVVEGIATVFPSVTR